MSFSKILLTVVIIFAVWHGFRWLSRLAEQLAGAGSAD